tara:strand:+ start:202 stop:696 length:495 start_codon:yes stop_codon:yes gene_type:complete
MKLIILIILITTIFSCSVSKKNYLYNRPVPSIYSSIDSVNVKGFSSGDNKFTKDQLDQIRSNNDTNTIFNLIPVLSKKTDQTRKSRTVGLYKFEKYRGPFPPSQNVYYFFLKTENNIFLSVTDSDKINTYLNFKAKYNYLFSDTELKRMKETYTGSGKYFSGSY